MPVPDYQSLMLPLLELAKDGLEHRIGDTIAPLAERFGLSEDEVTEMLPSGRQPIFNNRVHWAKTYLSQAGLLEITRRGHFRITDRGLAVLGKRPDRIDTHLLEQFQDFRDFRARGKDSQAPKLADKPTANDQLAEAAPKTPDEILRSTVGDLEVALASELLARIMSSPAAFFENLIVTLLLSMGYGGSREEAGRAIGKSGDGGIDGVIYQDSLGLDRVYLQAKRYKADTAVSEPEIRGFSGSLGAAKANKGVFVTTSYFTKPANDFAERHPFKMVLIDGAQLTNLMIRHNVGVRVSETLYIKTLDEDFFPDE
jgi:restriction system protein